MKPTLHAIAVSLLVIAIGIAWLLNTMHILPGVNWVWTIGLAAGGVFVLALGGLNKLSVVVGPFLIIASVFSLLRQRGAINVDHEVPSLVIALGALMLLSAIAPLPQAGSAPPK
jgi:hypothetical protein